MGSRAPASKSGRACPPSLWTTKPNQYVLRKTSGAEEDNRKEAKEAIEAEAASQDHGHVQDQPEQVLGGVGGGLPRHNHCQGASNVAGRQHGGGGAAEQRERGEGEAAQWKAGSLCLPLAESSTLLLHTSLRLSSSTSTPLCRTPGTQPFFCFSCL